jgi:hypothetical protein
MDVGRTVLKHSLILLETTVKPSVAPSIDTAQPQPRRYWHQANVIGQCYVVQTAPCVFYARLNQLTQ